MNTTVLSLLLPVVFSGGLPVVVQEGPQAVLNRTELRVSFFEAAVKGSTEILRELLREGVDVNTRDNDGWTALHWAALHGWVDVVKLLIEEKAFTDARIEGGLGTALHTAVEGGHLEIIRLLLQAGSDVNARNIQGATALHCAARSGKVDCVKALVVAKPDLLAIDNDGWTALHRAIAYTHIDCANFLAKNSYLLVPSREAVSQSRRRIFNQLLQFVWLRKRYPELDNLKAESLQFEILSWNQLLQEDLVTILLDELKKGREIKAVALIRSKESAVRSLIKKLTTSFSQLNGPTVPIELKDFADSAKLEEKFGTIVREGLDERCAQLKMKER